MTSPNPHTTHARPGDPTYEYLANATFEADLWIRAFNPDGARSLIYALPALTAISPDSNVSVENVKLLAVNSGPAPATFQHRTERAQRELIHLLAASAQGTWALTRQWQAAAERFPDLPGFRQAAHRHAERFHTLAQDLARRAELSGQQGENTGWTQ